LQLLGALGVFLFGMKYMSEGLQRVAGSRLKALLGKVTGNRFTAVFSGLTLTTLIQSSSASTVMIVSFVTAGLMGLTQAIGMIMGANIGTTVTAWIVSLLGFKVNISAFALPAVGIGLAMTFFGRMRQRDVGEVLIGFGLLFLGLQLLREAIPPISGPDELEWLKDLTGFGFSSILIFVGVGTVLTIVLQSSSATSALTLTLAAMGWLPYEMAAAMILGENIGTTITANLAAIGATTDAKRAARVHTMFNVFGVLWALALFHVYLLPFVNLLVPGNPNVDFAAIQGDPAAVALASGIVTTHLAAVHTTFNVTNTALMLPFTKQLEWLAVRWVPDKQAGKTRLRYMHAGLIETPELLLAQAGREMQHMSEVVREMFAASMQILTHPHDKLRNLVDETLDREEVVDGLEREISELLSSTARAATSGATAARVAEMVQNTHRLERIGDHCACLVRIARRVHDSDTPFRDEDIEELAALGSLVNDALANLGHYLCGQSSAADGEAIEVQIDQLRRTLRARHIDRLQQSAAAVTSELGFLDTITHLEEIGDRACGIIRLAEENRKQLRAA
jgi:phosphate:Na+ symporter